jgi:Protein of unknown function (DUF2442)
MNELVKPIRVEALAEYRLYIEFADGERGEVDLSRLVGRGVFEVWKNRNFFDNVRLGDHRQVKWDDDIELSADSLYLELTHKSPEDLFPAHHVSRNHI